jgi:hypothetical protein
MMARDEDGGRKTNLPKSSFMTICMAVKEVSKAQESSSMCRRCVEQGKSMTTPSNDWSWLASAVAGPNSRHYEDEVLAGARAILRLRLEVVGRTELAIVVVKTIKFEGE